MGVFWGWQQFWQQQVTGLKPPSLQFVCESFFNCLCYNMCLENGSDHFVYRGIDTYMVYVVTQSANPNDFRGIFNHAGSTVRSTRPLNFNKME